jgi:hypothetical protein
MTTKLEGARRTSCPSTGRRHRRRQPAPERQHRTAYLWEEVWAARQPARHPRALPAPRGRGEEGRREDHPQGAPDLPALPPARLRAEARGRRAREGRRAELPGPALGRLGKSQLHRLARPPPRQACTTRPTRRSSTRSSSSPTARARQAAPGHDLPVRAQAGRREKIDEHSPARRGARDRRADRHHDAPEVPLRHREDRRAAERRYAVIVDEAHSSQSGEMAAKMKEVLGGAEHRRGRRPRRPEDVETTTRRTELSCKAMAARGRQPNLSFFAFTATPKYKTLEVFGHRAPTASPPLPPLLDAPGHRGGLHPRRAANYTTYKRYFGSSKRRRRPRARQAQGGQALARFVSLHPTTSRRRPRSSSSTSAPA